ncbi:MAG: phosphotransferase [Paracoccaceae bacterium]
MTEADPAGEGRRADLARRLSRALAEAGHPAAGTRAEPMADKGLAHDHLRLPGTDLVARCPKQSQMGLAAHENLAYQAACFARAAESGHAPRLHGVIAPSDALPRGGLLVEEIEGRAAELPQDLDAIVAALASIHALPVPPVAERPPLLAPDDPLGAMIAEIEAQARYLDTAGVEPFTRTLIGEGLAGLKARAASPDRPEARLISFDAHPGNFLVRDDGRAVLVDLEKARYGPPPLDLAHATLYTSTTWDIESHAVLDTERTAEAMALWLDRYGEGADAMRPWIAPLRRAMWLWSLSWCAKWRALSGRAAATGADGEDWSADSSDDALVVHVRDRVDHYLDPQTAAFVAADCDALQARFGAA